SLRIFDLESGKITGEVGQGWRVRYVAVHPGGRLLAFSSDGTHGVHVLDREDGQVVRSFTGLESRIDFNQVAWHADGRTLAAASDDHHVYVFNVETGERSRILQGHTAEARMVDFIPGGSILASTGWDPALRIWDSSSDRPIFSLANRNAFGFLADG